MPLLLWHVVFVLDTSSFHISHPLSPRFTSAIAQVLPYTDLLYPHYVFLFLPWASHTPCGKSAGTHLALEHGQTWSVRMLILMGKASPMGDESWWINVPWFYLVERHNLCDTLEASSQIKLQFPIFSGLIIHLYWVFLLPCSIPPGPSQPFFGFTSQNKLPECKSFWPLLLARIQSETVLLCLDSSLFINYFLNNGHLDYFLFFIVINNVVRNILINTSLHTWCLFS